MKIRSWLVALVAMCALSVPIAASALTFHVNNQSDAWVLLSAVYTPVKESLAPSHCVAPDQTHVLSAARVKMIYFIALTHANCVAPREWEHGVTIDGRGATVSAGHSGATIEPNAGSDLRVVNRSGAWLLLALTPMPTPSPPVTTFCVPPGAHMHTHDNFPNDARPYIIISSGTNCGAPRIHEQFAAGNNIIVTGTHGMYAVKAVP